MPDKYIDLFTDFGFKKIFGEEANENLLIDRSNRQKYEDSLKAKRDWKNSLDTSFDEGMKQKGLEIAEKAKEKGFSIEDIMELTGFSREQIERL